MENIWFGTICNNKIFLPSAPNIRSLKDKLVTKIFTTAFQKVKLNPGYEMLTLVWKVLIQVL